MENLKKIDVNLEERSYNILIVPNLLDDLSNKLSKRLSGRKALIITDDNVNQLYGEKVLKKVGAAAEKAYLSSIKYPIAFTSSRVSFGKYSVQ